MKGSTVLSKEDCRFSMTEEENRQVLIAMLDALAEFCDQHGLSYYLSGGTLLGALRHHGFIPWDDDIDVNMPRPDCEKLMRLTEGKLGPYRLTGPDDGEFLNNVNYFRLYNDDTVVENFKGGATEEHPFYHPIFIDIFPIEGLPEGKVRCYLHWARAFLVDKMRVASVQQHVESKTAKAHIFYFFSVIPARIVGYHRWGKAVEKCATKFSFDEEKFVGVTTTLHYLSKEKVEKEKFMETVEVEFEGKKYHAPGNYDTYLTQLYGDYMKMPPMEEQKSHHAFHLYWRTQH